MDIDDLRGQYLMAAAEYARAWAGSSGRGEQVTQGANRAADELRHIASTIGQGGPAYVRAFSSLFEEHRNDVRIWAAFHALEVMQSPSDMVDRAFDILEERAKGDSLNALGTRMRLKELYAQFGREPR